MPAERRRQARKKAGGRPRGIDDGNLFNQRNGFLDLFINNWGGAGWGFECARTPAQLVSVFASLEVPPYQQRLVVPFQQATTTTVTAAEIREMRRALGAANEKLYALLESIRPLADAVRESMEALRNGRRGGHVDALHEEHRRRLMDYGPVYGQLQDAEDQQSILQSQLTIAEASYAQYEVLAFLGASKYTHNPRNLACAMAGLPQIGCWQSFRRCASEPSHLWPSYRYEAFELIARSLRPRARKDEIINALRDSILGIQPRTRLREDLKRHLCDNWLYLRRAVEATDIDELVPGNVPYRIYGTFTKLLYQSTSAEERVLAAYERLRS